MPDFALHRPSERKPPARALKPLRKRPDRPVYNLKTSKSIPNSGETRQVRSNGERPASLFRKLLQDFHSGVSALRGLSKSGSKPDLADRSYKNVRLKPITELSVGKKDLQTSERTPKSSSSGTALPLSRRSRPVLQFKAPPGSIREALPPAALPAVALRSSNLPQRGVIGAHSAPPSRIRASYHTRTLGADREAQHQVLSGEYTGSVHHLPSAARLAQILRAESLIKAGEAQPNGMIFALSQAIREGRRREVADLNPEVVQGALFSSLGGPTRAKQLLSSSMTHGLITRHQIALEALQKDIRSVGHESSQRARADFLGSSTTRTRAGRASTRKDSRAPEFMAPSPALVSAAAHAVSGTGAGTGAGTGTAHSYSQPGSGMEANLRDMMTVNELPHLNEVAMNERERLQASGTRPEVSTQARQASVPSSGTRPEFSPQARQGSINRGVSYSPIGESGTRSPIAASIDAPKPQARAQPQAQSGDTRQRSSRPQTLKGTLQLRGHNNQLLGVAELQNGEITNG